MNQRYHEITDQTTGGAVRLPVFRPRRPGR